MGLCERLITGPGSKAFDLGRPGRSDAFIIAGVSPQDISPPALKVGTEVLFYFFFENRLKTLGTQRKIRDGRKS